MSRSHKESKRENTKFYWKYKLVSSSTKQKWLNKKIRKGLNKNNQGKFSFNSAQKIAEQYNYIGQMSKRVKYLNVILLH